MADRPSIGVVGATGAVGSVTLDLLRTRGYENVRIFASARSAGRKLGDWTVEEATPDALSRGDIDVPARQHLGRRFLDRPFTELLTG